MVNMSAIQLGISAFLGLASSILYPGFKDGSYNSLLLTIIFITIFLVGKGFGEINAAAKIRESEGFGVKKK